MSSANPEGEAPSPIARVEESVAYSPDIAFTMHQQTGHRQGQEGIGQTLEALEPNITSPVLPLALQPSLLQEQRSSAAFLPATSATDLLTPESYAMVAESPFGASCGQERGVEVDEEVRRASHFTLRDKLFYLFDGLPVSYKHVEELAPLAVPSRLIVSFTMLLVVTSVSTFAVGTLPQYWNSPPQVLGVIETICVVWFTVELLIRFLSTRDKKKFLKSVLNWIDFFSIVPYYVELFAGSSGNASGLIILRVVRLARAVRVFKLSKHSRGLHQVSEAVARSTAGLSLLSFLLTIVLLIFSTVIYMAEQMESDWQEPPSEDQRGRWVRYDGSHSPFQSIIHTMWYVLVTITMVGYGDDVPWAPLTKVLACFLMIMAAFVVAFPVVILSANFQDVTQEDKENQSEDDGFRRHFEGTTKEGAVKLGSGSPNNGEGMTASPGSPSNTGALSGDKGEGAEVNSSSGRLDSSRRRESAAESFVFLSQSTSEREMWSLKKKHPKLTAVELRSYEAERKVKSRRGDAVMCSAICYRVAPGAPERLIYLRGAAAFYSPVLMLECHSRHGEPEYGVHSEGRVKVGVRQNFPNGLIATFQLMLHTKNVEKAVNDAVDAERLKNPAAKAVRKVEPRRIKSLRVAMRSSHSLLHSAGVITSKFKEPVGTIPIEVYIPKIDALPILLKYSVAVGFRFLVDYYDGGSYVVDPVDGMAGLSLLHMHSERIEEDGGAPASGRATRAADAAWPNPFSLAASKTNNGDLKSPGSPAGSPRSSQGKPRARTPTSTTKITSKHTVLSFVPPSALPSSGGGSVNTGSPAAPPRARSPPLPQ